MDTVYTRYALSLFELAKEENKVEEYQKDMIKVQSVFADESIVKFFGHVALPLETKKEVIDQSFLGQVSDYVYNFLLLLIKKRRINAIMGICDEFQSLCNDYFGIKVGKVYSAYELSDAEVQKIETAIGQKINAKVQLNVIIDESLIGGVRVEIDNHIYDDSLSYKLGSLKKELLRR
ncbi:MAG: F0F1 ATP synthase subunit delta [Erysipelotrichaceae bacterium]|nr:F0F1 ATP synthase subunit delta [Erysipelotrichaceae bacterium]